MNRYENIRDKRGRFLKGSKYTDKQKEELSKRRIEEYKTGIRKPYNKGGKCSLEHRKKVSEALKGKIHPPVSEETKRKMSERLKKLWQNPEYKEAMIKKHLGKKHSKETIEKRVRQFRGEKSHFWKGGITPLRRRIRNSFKYRQWRSDIFTRDNFTCQKCNDKGISLAVDHFPKSFSQIIKEYNIKTLEEAINCEELWNINNGRTLCEKCHLKTENYGNRKKI